MKNYLIENNFKIQNKELINMKILALKRLSVKEQYRKSLMVSNLNHNNNEISDPNNIAYLNIDTENLQSFGYVDNNNRKFDGKLENSDSVENSTPSKENNFSFRSIDVEDNSNNYSNNNIEKQKTFEINSQDFAIVNEAGTKVNLKILNNKFQIQNSSYENNAIEQVDNKRRFTNLIMGKDNVSLIANTKSQILDPVKEETKEVLVDSSPAKGIILLL